ncbi:hypothetical protein [Paenibacillus hexagrammi]|uniref:Spore coat protein n=1 Tax=Paenibacillus hexagrammi TaxID=2908839 RepID=A0ABY3SIV5_9BACL|nr:hypothetical protein [Paenibacillus sp. YPD9-1]UJF33842.1 hypothetical protein L0M14_00820 [Paenibacillus sp. YPD9-1]
MDCDQKDMQCGMDAAALKEVLEKTLETETELLRTYTITSERVHGNEQLKDRLQNFAEGNAKRSRQLLDELKQLKQ